ncbi:tetratricopeptide repeat protein [Brucepastera parasyntrophica]|uniref:tetratricopeptide repeat protein n=1 Tax=Brucepastera parasyntrophica TaxID=2880008 RepID=UPI002108814A|nr:tetratricopeptide repeat protein [Brucepastera parasyntrophica]ULQ59902.1 tetratricopeptide repeat protein [Brucepastera parasyntrophica]
MALKLATSAPKNVKDKKPVDQAVNNFLTKYRNIILIVFAVLVCFLIVFAVSVIVRENKSNTAFDRVEQLVSDLNSIRSSSSDQTDLLLKEDAILEELAGIAAKNKGNFGGVRANMVAADVYFSRNDWKNAREKYLAAGSYRRKAYTNGLNYFNAAVCADELGNADEAVDFLNKAVSFDNFPIKSRALFNIGRIEEQRMRYDDAITAYEKLTSQYPDDNWALLAESRIIALEIR